jgi:hypothetical protein
LKFILVNYISDPVGFQHPHGDSVVLENRNQISNVREVILCVVLEPRSGFYLVSYRREVSMP